jgi:hypothetical protein
VRTALATLPGVEKDSISVSKDESRAMFRVTDTEKFKVTEAIDKIKEVGFTPSLTKAGKTVQQ